MVWIPEIDYNILMFYDQGKMHLLLGWRCS